MVGCGGYRPSEEGWGCDRRPVINVTWNDAQSYAAWLSRQAGKDYHLLSEAEREYVTRAGTTTPFWWGYSITTKQANYDGRLQTITYYGEGKGEYRGRTEPVDSFSPNPWGPYNVHGNFWEWTQDCWNRGGVGNTGDGSAKTTGDCNRRVLRGGFWNSEPNDLRAASRDWFVAGSWNSVSGFRVARTLSP
jgi:formylglycine-generating enzyme required for sulfatase activity